MVLVTWLMPQKDALMAILLGMAVAEAGFVTASVPLTMAATDCERGLASGVLSTATRLGNALGFAAVGAVIAAATGPVGADALLSGLRWGLWSATAFAVLALMLVVVSMGSSSRRQPEI